MGEDKIKDLKFGDIALDKGYVSQKNIDRALSIQMEVYRRAKVFMPIGEVLVEMGLLTAEQRNEVLLFQQNSDRQSKKEENPSDTEDESIAEVENDDSSESDDDPPAESTPPPENERITLQVAHDRLSATILAENPGDVSPDDVMALIAENGIQANCVDEDIIKEYLQSASQDPLNIAEGRAAEPGKPAHFTYKFDIDALKIGTMQEDGTIDWKNRGEIPQTQPGDILAEKHPGSEGTPGLDIFGNAVPAPAPKDIPFKIESGVQVSEDGTKALATTEGMPKLSASGELSVCPTLFITGDVGVETGHVDYDGHIEVSGSVQSGYKIKGKSLNVQEIYEAEITLNDDLVVAGGIFNTTISSGGHTKAGHIHNSTIFALGNIIVNKEIFDSKIEVGGKCTIAGGDIVATRIAAKKGIIAQNIGTEASKPSTLDVGRDYRMEREVKALKKELAENLKLKEKSLVQINKLKEHSSQINLELGEIAQTQDKYMVQQRNLEDKLEEAKGIDSDVEQNVSQAIKKLAVEQDSIDKQVEDLMNEDEKLGDQIDDMEAEVQKLDEHRQKLEEQNEILQESAKIDKRLAVAKISGDVFAGTTVMGPHTNITTSEDLKRVRFGEIQESGSSGQKEWVMKLSPLR